MANESRAEFSVRTMTRAETDLIRFWATAEDWNPGLHDGGCFYDTDPAGFFVGELAGEPIACISCVAYDDCFGFLGQYIVKPEYRGRGYGLEVWRAGLAYLGERNVGLDGVVAQQANYRKSGFRFAYNHIRYRCIAGGQLARDVVAISDVPFDEVAAFDRRMFPCDRTKFLRGWLTLPGAIAIGCLRNGRLLGYGVMRLAVDGYKVGPLFAEESRVADGLFQSLLSYASGRPVVIDIPDETANPFGTVFVRRHGLSEVFRTARMYTKAVPKVELHCVYGVTSLELG